MAEVQRARQFELPSVIAELNLLIERYEFTEAMIFGTIRMDRPGRPKTVMVPKYVDQATGNTWTGRGPKPTWLAEALVPGSWPRIFWSANRCCPQRSAQNFLFLGPNKKSRHHDAGLLLARRTGA